MILHGLGRVMACSWWNMKHTFCLLTKYSLLYDKAFFALRQKNSLHKPKIVTCACCAGK